mmetsp:Transcript_28797/g.51510  ORF Transcript_28797/g.51510 Transcript_28797/m.51510 type:complete len:300 (-) Transcript_28797:81-980(-)
MKVLITGATGQTGRASVRLLRQKHEVRGTCFSRQQPGLVRLDLRDAEAVKLIFEDFQPDAVIHCAAERRPDVCEKDQEGTLKLNATATGQLAELCEKHDCMLVYLSTDYVFDGTNPPYKPKDATNPLQFYGQSKLQGEAAVLSGCPSRAAVLRVPVLYAKDPEGLEESAITVLASNVMRKDTAAKLDDWGKRYPTLVDDVAQCMSKMIEYEAVRKGSLTGIWHCGCTAEVFTKFAVAKLMGEVLGLPTSHLSGDPNPPAGAPRPHDTKLDCSDLERLGLLPRMTPLREALPQVLGGALI